MSLLQRVESSNYLSDLLSRNEDLLIYARDEQVVDASLLRGIIQNMDEFHDRAGVEQVDQTSDRSRNLRLQKQRFSLLWSIAELSDSIEFSELGDLQSNFAAATIEVALDIALHHPRIRKLFKPGDALSPKTSGIFILGLGKLGGLDLNFSSDIDLIAFYDKASLNTVPMVGASYAVTECLKQLSSILSEQTQDGFVWRVDWRLRPHASLRNLSMVSEKALDFYHYQAQPWHRLAMIKAQPVAGNRQFADAFLSDLLPFLWRRSLDYRAIDDIAMLKTKINLEHPALATQRAQKELKLDQSRGTNLKLGFGGIREIEFIVNALQMLWGGRKPALRISNTLRALSVLEAEGLMAAEDAVALRQAYRFLRKAENRLQMQDNAQIVHVPEDESKLAAYLSLWKEDERVLFEQTLMAHRKQVHAIFEANFDQEMQATDQQAEMASGVSDLSETELGILQAWEGGFCCYGLASGQSDSFQPLYQALMREVNNSGCEPGDAIRQIDDYFRRLPPGGQYFRLLRDFPWLLEKIIAPLLLSPTMTSLLKQSPHIIDRFLEQSVLTKLDTTIVFSSADYESRLENIRRLANEELYMRYSDFFEASTGSVHFQQQLTTLAESLLSAAVQIACDEMGLLESPIAVIGFGKLGAQGMMPKSDLDLVYLCDSMQGHALASQFASRLNTIINTPMREGRVYELDTRLRPSGQSGSVTISLSSYEQHQFERAQSWSHLAMVPARFVAGNQRVGQKFNQIKQAVLSRPRRVLQFKNDCAKMLQRVQQQKIAESEPDQFIAKNRPGGLFELEYLVYCMSVLASVEQPELTEMSFEDLLIAHDKNYPGLIAAYDCLRCLQLEIRLFGRDGDRFSSLPEPILKHVLNAMQCPDIEALIEKITKATSFVIALRTTYFECIDWSTLSDWKEDTVEWL